MESFAAAISAKLMLSKNRIDMKQHIIKFMGAVWLLTTAYSCKPDMDLNNPAEVSTGNYYQTVDELRNAVIPAYQALIGRSQGGYCFQTLFTLLAPGDDYRKTYKMPSMYQDTYNTPAGDDAAKLPWKDWFGRCDGCQPRHPEKINAYTPNESE